MSQIQIKDAQIDKILERHKALQDKLSGQLDREEFVRASKDFADIAPVAEAALTLRNARRERADLAALVNDPDTDGEMAQMARAELEALEERIPDLDWQMQVMLLPKDEADDKGAILEVRAGTGGEEAALFAGNLFSMYSRYAENHGWKVEVMSASESDLGGYKEIIASISGKGVYAKLKFEAGTHRVQRVPETEGGGRIHTSAATVAVLPEAEDVDLDVAESDLRIDIYRASGAGGQHVNTTDSAVRITHVPTGLVVTCQDERSQHKNKAKAMKIMRARLYETLREQAAGERAAERKGQVGSGDRSERIRTYNFPQGRVTDHRINLTLYKLDAVIAGEALDELIDALSTADQAARLAAIGEETHARA